MRHSADAALDGGPRAVVLVEGLSDRLALEVLARRRGCDLAAGRIAVIAMNGATNLGRYLERYGPAGLNVKLAGLCDAAEEDYFRRALRRAGIGAGGSRAAMEALGFFVCTIDLEDELIRALGTDEVERIIEAQGELRSLRTLQRQPAQRGRPAPDQLRRFMSGRSGNKYRYARLLAGAADLNRMPRPLDGILAHVCQAPGAPFGDLIVAQDGLVPDGPEILPPPPAAPRDPDKIGEGGAAGAQRR